MRYSNFRSFFDDFALWLNGMMNNLAVLGDELQEETSEKFLWAVSPHYSHVALYIDPDRPLCALHRGANEMVQRGRGMTQAGWI